MWSDESVTKDIFLETARGFLELFFLVGKLLCIVKGYMDCFDRSGNGVWVIRFFKGN